MLIELLPGFYGLCRETKAIEDALEKGISGVQAARDDCLLQLDLNTATWGLDYWEDAYGIPREAGKDYAYRRTRILSKMRGSGTTTAELIQNVAESFINGQVEVIEFPEADDVWLRNVFHIRFGQIGIPPNLDDLKAAVEEIKPAHLKVEYIIAYRTSSELHRYTHTQLGQYTHAQLREGGNLT